MHLWVWDQPRRVGSLYLIEEQSFPVRAVPVAFIVAWLTISAIGNVNIVVVIDEMHLASGAPHRRSKRIVHHINEIVHSLTPILGEVFRNRGPSPELPRDFVAGFVGRVKELGIADVVATRVSSLPSRRRVSCQPTYIFPFSASFSLAVLIRSSTLSAKPLLLIVASDSSSFGSHFGCLTPVKKLKTQELRIPERSASFPPYSRE